MRGTTLFVVLGTGFLPGNLALAQERREFGAAAFSPPAGFTLDAKPTMLSYWRIRDRDLCMIVVYGAEPAAPGLEAAFADSWSTVFKQGYRRAERPPVRTTASPAGYRHAVGEGELEDLQGNRFLARMQVFPIGTRTQTVVWMANGRAALEGCRPEWEAFFSSLELKGVAVASGTEGAAAANPRAETAPPSSSRVDSSAAPGEFGNIRFTSPRGWRVERAAGSVVLAPSLTRPGEMLQVVLLPGRPARGTLAAEFGPTWEQIVRGYGATPMTEVSGGNYTLGEPGRSLRGYEYLRGTGGMRRGTESYTLDLYLFRAGDRVEQVLVLARQFRANLLTVTAAMNPVHERAIRRLVFSLDFANQPARAAGPARLATAGIGGVWAGISMSFGSLKPTFAILFEDGIAFFGATFPTGGLAGIEPAIEQPANRRSWGTWSASGDRGEIVMPYGKIPIRVLGTGLELTTSGTPHRFVRLSMPAGNQLEGTWCLSGGQCLVLRPGGRFEDAGAARVLEHATYDYPESPERGQGAYRLEDHSLILDYDGGPEIRIAFPGLDGGPTSSPQQLLLSFNLDGLRRR